MIILAKMKIWLILETDKVTLDVPSPVSGKVISLSVGEGETVEANALLAIIEEGAAAEIPADKPSDKKVEPSTKTEKRVTQPVSDAAAEAMPLSPAVRRLVDENNLDPKAMTGTGKDGRLTKGDVLSAMASPSAPAFSCP